MTFQGEGVVFLLQESGGHRIQRVPPTERHGRVHTSTVTVACVLELSQTVTVQNNDFRVETFSGTGKGGQHRNKKMTSARVIHKNGMVETRQGRSLIKNIEEAKAALTSKIKNTANHQHASSLFNEKKEKMGSGERGDKIRTYRFSDDVTKDHRTNKTESTRKIMNGYFDKLW